MEPPKKLLIFQEGTFQPRKKKHSEKYLYFGKLNFLASSLRKLLIFQEGTCKA